MIKRLKGFMVTIADFLTSMIKTVKLNLNQIKWFIQRGKRGWADCDWWNLDSYITRIMLEAGTELLYNGCHLGCGMDWAFTNSKLSKEDKEEASRVHHLYQKILRFFELHKLFMDEPRYWHNKQLRREYKASGLLLIRNFGRLWD